MAPPPTLDSGSVTSVYLDALPDLPSYHERLRREDGASAVRVRWYGDRTPFDPGQPLYVERKVHREALSNEFSTKERAQLAQGEVLAFLEGRLVVDLGTKEGALLGSVQSRVAALQQASHVLARRPRMNLLLCHTVIATGDINPNPN